MTEEGSQELEDSKRHIFQKGKEKDLKNYRPIDLTSNPDKAMEQIILEGISKHMKDREVMSQHELIKQESCLNSLIAFHNKVELNR